MLKITNLHSIADNKKILNGINLTAKKGELHVIMGPNGAGKSTLASVIAGKEKFQITEGEVEYNGVVVNNLPPEKRAHLGIFLAFQYPIEIPGVSTINFLKSALNEIKKSKGEKTLDAVEFMEYINEKKKVFEIDESLLKRSLNSGFSGGEKKRNEMFQMAILDPSLCVLDETDSGLDIDALKIVANGINKLKSDDSIFIVITHYMKLLEYIQPDKIHIMQKGKIIKSGGIEIAHEIEKNGYDLTE